LVNPLNSNPRCSLECKNTDSLHKDSCKYLACISGISGSASVDYDLLKLIIIIIIQRKRYIKGTPIECLYNLLSHHKSQPKEFKDCLLTASKDFISTFPNITTIEEMVKLGCKINANSHAITELSTNTPIAVGMFPLIAMCNHSCNPNAIYINSGGSSLTLRAIKQIPLATQITVSYVDLFAPRWERRGKLLASKYFWCCCERCENDLDLVLDAMICTECRGYCIGQDDLTCHSCSFVISSTIANETIKNINTKIEFGMEMYSAGMFESASITLQETLNDAISKLHPLHAIFSTLLVNLVNLYSKTNQFVLALKICDMVFYNI
jgi:SET domain